MLRKYPLLEEIKDGDGGAPAADPPEDPPVETTWPDNWRDLYAGEDEKKKNVLERYASPNAAFDGLIAAKERIRSGELKTALPENPTDEEMAAWRADHGIPETPDKYDLTFDDGLVIGEDDKETIDGFIEAAHKANYTPDQVKNAIRWYYDEQEKQAEARYTEDENIRQRGEDELRAEWGQEYRRNINLINGLLDTAPEGLKDKFLGGRLSDGTPIASDPDALKFLIKLALDINPITTLVPANTGDVMGSIEDEIKKIEDFMRTNRQDYNRDDKMQQRLRDLYAARDKHKAA